MTPVEQRLRESGVAVICIRASSLPLAFRCAQSLRPRPPVIDERNEAADMGTAAHDWCATCGWDLDRVDGIAAKHSVDSKELRVLCAKARRMANELGIFDGVAEQAFSAELDDVVVTGHADWVDQNGARARVIDWKFGMKDRDHYQQMRGYACLVMRVYDCLIDEVQTITAWVRDEEIESHIFRLSDYATWRDDVVALAKDATYRPGTHCQHCRRLHECEAGKTLISRDIQLFGGAGDIATMAPEQAIELLEKADMVAALAKRVRESFRDHVLEHGDVVAEDGKRLTIQTQKNRELDPLKAWSTLEEWFSVDEIASATKVSLTTLEEVAAKKAGKGQGAARKRQLNLALESAIELKEVNKLVVRRS